MKVFYGMLIVFISIGLTGCIMNVLSPDLSKANWFGCTKEERLKPTTRGMFGTNKGDAECLKSSDPRYHYYNK